MSIKIFSNTTDEGLRLYKNNSFAEAASCFQNVLATDPNNVISSIFLIDSLRMLNRFDETREVFIKAIALRPDSLFVPALAKAFLMIHDRTGILLPDDTLETMLSLLPEPIADQEESFARMRGMLLFLRGPGKNPMPHESAAIDGMEPAPDFDQLEDFDASEKAAGILFVQIARDLNNPLAWARAFHCAEVHAPHRAKAKAGDFAILASHDRREVRQSVLKGLDYHVSAAIFANDPSQIDELHAWCLQAYKRHKEPEAAALLSKLCRFSHKNPEALEWTETALASDQTSALILNEAFKAYAINARWQLAHQSLLSAMELDFDSTFRDVEFDLVNILLRQPKLRKGLTEWIEVYAQSHPYSNYKPTGKSRRAFLDLVRLREKFIAQKLPSCMLVTMPKSGSIAVGSIFSHGFGLPHISYYIGMSVVVSAWARDYARGGCCAITHTTPRPENIEKLVQAGLEKVTVHIRDLRQVAVSMAHHFAKYQHTVPENILQIFDKDLSLDERLEYAIAEEIKNLAVWLQSWIDVQNSGKMRVTFTSFETMVRQPDVFLKQVLDAYGGDRSLFNPNAVSLGRQAVDTHFRKGSVDEWRKVLSNNQIERLEEIIPKHFYERFDWIR